MSLRITAVLASLFALLASACATTAPVHVEYAPRVAGAEAIYSMSVLDFEGRGGADFADAVEAELVGARFRGAPAVTIIDPSLAGRGYGRGRYRGGVMSPAALVEIGERLGVDAIVAGAMLGDRVRDSVYTRERNECVSRDSDGDCVDYRTYVVDCWNVHVDVDARVLLVAVPSARTLYNDVLRGDSHMSYCADERMPYSVGELTRRAVTDAARPVRELFLPHERVVHAPFQRPSEGLGEVQTARFEQAYDLAGQDRLSEACAIWRELEQTGLRTPGLVYNIGLCAELTGHLEAALALYDEAIALSVEEFDDAREARERVLIQMRERDRLGG